MFLKYGSYTCGSYMVVFRYAQVYVEILEFLKRTWLRALGRRS